MKTKSQTYRPGVLKTVLLGLGSLLFVVSGIFMADDDPIIGWLAISFFGIGLLVFIVQLIPGSTELTLTEEGFVMTSLFRKRTTKWSDVESFKIGYLGRSKTIMFDFVEGHNRQTTGKLISKALSGSHGALPITYGLKATELLQILNEWKNKHDHNKLSD